MASYRPIKMHKHPAFSVKSINKKYHQFQSKCFPANTTSLIWSFANHNFAFFYQSVFIK